MRRFWAVLVSLFFLCYMGIQVYFALTAPIVTEQVMQYSIYDSISANGFFIRNEQLITSQESGVVDYRYDDGERVARYSVVATMYETAEDIDTNERIKQLRSEIDQLSSAQSPTGLVVSDPVAIESRIDSIVSDTVYASRAGYVTEVYNSRGEINTLIDRRRYVTGQVDNFNDEISNLNLRINELSSKMKSSGADIRTDVSGYFSSTIDGLEGSLYPGMIDSLSPQEFERLVEEYASSSQKEPEDGAIGKIITDFNWYFAVETADIHADSLNVGKTLSLNFPFSLGHEIPVRVHSVYRDEKSDKCVVTFYSDYIIKDIPRLREQTVDIILNEYSGLRIPNSALRIVDGKTGVYVLSGIQAKFKPVDIIYAKDNYKIVRYDPLGGSSQLHTDDEVIVRGKDLSDGKIIK